MSEFSAIQKLKSFAWEAMLWRLMGQPMRDEEESATHSLICAECERYDVAKGRCGICGCKLGPDDMKMRWATTRCPDTPPRWVERADLTETIGGVRRLADDSLAESARRGGGGSVKTKPCDDCDEEHGPQNTSRTDRPVAGGDR